jgi:hypothetical protein
MLDLITASRKVNAAQQNKRVLFGAAAGNKQKYLPIFRDEKERFASDTFGLVKSVGRKIKS